MIPAAFAQSTADCSVIHSKILKQAVPYCVVLPPSYAKEKTRHYPVVYYLHGLGDNEQSLVNLGGWNRYEELLRDKKVGEMVLAAPMGYRSFFINARDGKFNYEDFFLREFIPQIEAKYRAGGAKRDRAIVGISMGGFGSLHYGFEKPQMFAASVGIMPALFEKLPDTFGTAREQQMLKSVFGDAAHPGYFNKVSVFSLAERQPAAELRRVRFQFNAGSSDDYGFYEGVDALDKLLTRRGIPHDAHVYSGRHSMQYAGEHFGDALEFIWRSFGR